MTSRISGWSITTATGRFTASMRLLGYVDCLSRVPGDWYARFCGEGVIVILPPYPTRIIFPTIREESQRPGSRIQGFLFWQVLLSIRFMGKKMYRLVQC